MEEYKGPEFVEYDIQSEFRDSSRLKLRMTTKEHRVLRSGDQEFRQEMFAEFFDANEKKTSTLKADYGRFYSSQQLWFFKGDVNLVNLESDERLMSEELYWNVNKEMIYTDKFVKIKTPKYYLTGVGLEANQDFSKYKILKPKGKIYIEDEAN